MLAKQPLCDNTGQNIEASAVDELIEELVWVVLSSKEDVTKQAATGMLLKVPMAACNRFAARMVEMLASRKKTIRKRAADCLVAMGPVAIQPLFEALRDSRAPVFRVRVAGLLAQALRTQRLADFSQIAVGLFAIVLRTSNKAVAQAVWDAHGVFCSGLGPVVCMHARPDCRRAATTDPCGNQKAAEANAIDPHALVINRSWPLVGVASGA